MIVMDGIVFGPKVKTFINNYLDQMEFYFILFYSTVHKMDALNIL